MAYRTAKDIAIPAGTEVKPAPESTRRHTPHGSVILGHGSDSVSEWVMDLEEAIHEGLVEQAPESDHTHVARPVKVTAKRIEIVYGRLDLAAQKSYMGLILEDGAFFMPTDEMLARMTPQVGDYVVWQEDGYCYLNPKDVFERKYAPVDETEAGDNSG